MSYLILFNNCAYHFHEDPNNFKLTEEEKQIYISKKILYIGFDYVSLKRIPVIDILNQEKNITDSKHLKIIEFINSNLIWKTKNSFQTDYKINKGKSGYDTINEGYFKEAKNFSSLELNQEDFKKYTEVNNSINKENLKTFLYNYLSTTQHLGLEKMESILELKGKSVNLKLKNFDYILVGVGIFFSDDDYQINLYIYDSKLNLIKKSHDYGKVRLGEEYEKKAFDKHIVPFLKEFAVEIK